VRSISGGGNYLCLQDLLDLTSLLPRVGQAERKETFMAQTPLPAPHAEKLLKNPRRRNLA
jgi:hypothetical protein